jgi:hypothetical protein
MKKLLLLLYSGFMICNSLSGQSDESSFLQDRRNVIEEMHHRILAFNAYVSLNEESIFTDPSKFSEVTKRLAANILFLRQELERCRALIDANGRSDEVNVPKKKKVKIK